jgi:hypothetical protein
MRHRMSVQLPHPQKTEMQVRMRYLWGRSNMAKFHEVRFLGLRTTWHAQGVASSWRATHYVIVFNFFFLNTENTLEFETLQKMYIVAFYQNSIG